MRPAPDQADFTAFRDQLSARWRRRGALVVVPRVDSTNALLRRIASRQLRDGGRLRPLAAVAWEQTAGRGRGRRHWVSPPGRGVYLSLLLPDLTAARLATLPLLAPAAACRTLDRHLLRPCRVKWPNDLLVDGRKLGGVLIEALTTGGRSTAIVGVGVNHGRAVAGRLERQATWVLAEAAEPPTLAGLAAELAADLDRELEAAGDAAEAVRRYVAFSAHRRGDRLRCRTADGAIEGTFDGLDERGFLRLACAGGVRLLAAAEQVEPLEVER